MQRPAQSRQCPRRPTTVRPARLLFRVRSPAGNHLRRRRRGTTRAACTSLSPPNSASSTRIAAWSGAGAYADGSQNSENAFDARVDLLGNTTTWSVFATDTLSIGEAWNVTMSGRYNRTRVKNQDHLEPVVGGGSLDGHYTFSRFNPAVGVTYSPTASLNAYVGYSEGSRAPSSIELGCADPEHPCKLPNAMAGDPPLHQVVARTWELGVRGNLGAALRWNLGVFRASSDDDILFVADNQSGFGYFRNFGQTRRQGIEAGLSGSYGQFQYGANYTLLDANLSEQRDDQCSRQQQQRRTLSRTRRQHRDPVRRPYSAHPAQPVQGVRRRSARPAHCRSTSTCLPHPASMRAATRTTSTSPTASITSDPERHPATRCSTSAPDSRQRESLTLFFQVNNLFDREYYTSAQLGADRLHVDRQFHCSTLLGPRRRRRASRGACDVLRTRPTPYRLDRPQLCVRQARALTLHAPHVARPEPGDPLSSRLDVNYVENMKFLAHRPNAGIARTLPFATPRSPGASTRRSPAGRVGDASASPARERRGRGSAR